MAKARNAYKTLEERKKHLDHLAAQAEAGIPPDGSVWAKREAVEDSEPKNYYLGIRAERSAYQNVVILGMSFERTRGYYNKRTRSWRYEDGRTVIMPEKLAEAIREEAAHRQVFCRLYYDKRGRIHAVKKVDEIDDRDPRQARKMRAKPRLYDEIEKRDTHVWIPLSDMIMLEEVGEARGRVTTTDVMHAELAARQEKIDELTRLLEQQKALQKEVE